MNCQNYSNKRVAVLAVTSISGAVGGAERFYQGLVTAIQSQGLSAELINFPMDESDYENIQKNYEYWRNLDLSAYDLVISTKSPTYVIRHPRHILYLVHTTRVFYDFFDELNPRPSEIVNKQRQQILRMDIEALAQIKHRFVIGREVLMRLRWWNDMDAEVLHPPITLDCVYGSECHDYFFIPGRLHSWKRVDLAIRAIKLSNLPVKLLIAGVGEAEKQLKELADGDERIIFLGHVSDESLISLYANALAIIFVPIREDYGYVALEAFASGKPVITCFDSGEPLEFVKHRQTGLICESNPQSVCHALEEIFANKETAKTMGLQGMRSIKHITWDKVADTLLKAGFSQEIALPTVKVKQRVAVIDMQPIDPPIGGGRLRLLGLYHALGENIETKYVGAYDWRNEKLRRQMLTPGLEEIIVPLADGHHDAAEKLAKEAGGKVIIDLAFSRFCHLSREYMSYAREALNWADIVVFSHPWTFPALEKYLKPWQMVVYDAHNVEGYLRAQLLNTANSVELQLLREVVKSEYEAGCRADLIITCSQSDNDLFSKIYEWPTEKMRIMPNGVMVSQIAPLGPHEKLWVKQSIGLAVERICAIFMGSYYQPNIEAFNFIVNKLAPVLPEVDFVIAGGISAIAKQHLPKNVIVAGFLEEHKKILWLQAADLALNPMFSGSGTNIKMFDYMAAGLPIVTTAIGARGIIQNSEKAISIASDNDFAKKIKNFISGGELITLGMLNRVRVENDFAWEKITRCLGNLLIDKLDEKSNKTLFSKNDLKSDQKLKIAFMGTIGLKCGIGEYTARFIENFPQDVAKLIVTCKSAASSLDPSANSNAIIGWYYDNINFTDSAIDPDLPKRLKDHGVHGVLLQYHTAFFSENVLKKFVTALFNEQIKVVIIIHRVNGCNLKILKNLHDQGARLLSHSNLEIKAANKQGLRIEFIPHGTIGSYSGVLKTIAGRNWQTHPPIVATTGFLRSHKGYINLIRAIGLLQKDYPGAKLLLQCALYPSADSDDTLIACKKTIQQYGLEELVEFNTEFLPIDEVHHHLHKADIAVLAYDLSDEGGSGSAATCFAAGLPVVASNAQIFTELHGVVHTLADTRPESIAQSLVKILSSPFEYAQLVKSAHEYVRMTSFENVARHLIDIFTTSSSLFAVNENNEISI